MDNQTPDPVFHSSDIGRHTKAKTDTNYFVQIKDSPESRRKRRQARFRTWFRAHRFQLILGAIGGGVLVTVAAVVAVNLLAPHSAPTSDESCDTTVEEFSADITAPEATAKISEALTDGNLDAGLDVCSRLISVISSNETLAAVYSYCADQIYIFSRDNYSPYYGEFSEQLIEYALKAEELNPSVSTAFALQKYYSDYYDDAENAQKYADLGYQRLEAASASSNSASNTTESTDTASTSESPALQDYSASDEVVVEPDTSQPTDNQEGATNDSQTE